MDRTPRGQRMGAASPVAGSAPPERGLRAAQEKRQALQERRQAAQTVTGQHLSRRRQPGRPDRDVPAPLEPEAEAWEGLRPLIQRRVVALRLSCAVWSRPQEPRATAHRPSSLA